MMFQPNCFYWNEKLLTPHSPTNVAAGENATCVPVYIVRSPKWVRITPYSATLVFLMARHLKLVHHQKVVDRRRRITSHLLGWDLLVGAHADVSLLLLLSKLRWTLPVLSQNSHLLKKTFPIHTLIAHWQLTNCYRYCKINSFKMFYTTNEKGHTLPFCRIKKHLWMYNSNTNKPLLMMYY